MRNASILIHILPKQTIIPLEKGPAKPTTEFTQLLIHRRGQAVGVAVGCNPRRVCCCSCLPLPCQGLLNRLSQAIQTLQPYSFIGSDGSRGLLKEPGRV
ncbi:hypothetical protein Ddc_14491 [Ditylenchus destructor]|nr:hypothetical protein Ddc_14491 [Ditylenchus destructor]